MNLNTGRPRGPKDTLAPEGEMEEDRRSRRRATMDVRDRPVVDPDIYAAGTAGGGTAVGGLAGSNEGTRRSAGVGNPGGDRQQHVRCGRWPRGRRGAGIGAFGRGGGRHAGAEAVEREAAPVVAVEPANSALAVWLSRLARREFHLLVCDFVGLVHLLAGAGEARLEFGNFLAQDFDAFLRLFVHEMNRQWFGCQALVGGGD